MTDPVSTTAAAPSLVSATQSRTPASRLGVAVVQDLVAAIVRGDVAPETPLPREVSLAESFGVSRTVIRESVKRVEEKGLVRVEQGRGTLVQPSGSWNVLDPVVLSALVENDASLGILDDLAVVRSSLEGSMAALAAELRDSGDLQSLRSALTRMEEALGDESSFNDADAEFHFVVMAMSRNTLAGSMTRIVFQRARESSRFRGSSAADELETTLGEHRSVYDAIAGADADAAEQAMRSHIRSAWARRRPR